MKNAATDLNPFGRPLTPAEKRADADLERKKNTARLSLRLMPVLNTAHRQQIHRSAVDLAITDRRGNVTWTQTSLEKEAIHRLIRMDSDYCADNAALAIELWVGSYMQAARAICDLGAQDGAWRE
jgi:hypothetical protein